MEFNFLNVSSAIGAFVLLLLVVFLLTVETKRKLSNVFLALFLILIINDWLAHYRAIILQPIAHSLDWFFGTTFYLAPPLFYLFFKSSVYRDYKINRWTVLHALPFLVYNLVFLFTVYPKDWAGELTDEFAQTYYTGWFYKLAYIVIYVQLAFYYILIYRMLRKYRSLLRENYTNPQLDNHNWLLQILLVFVVFDSFGLINNIFKFSNQDYYAFGNSIMMLLALFVVGWVLINMLKNPSMFTGVYSNLQLVEDMVKGQPSKLTVVTNEDDEEALKKLRAHMVEHRPYLDPNLSMDELSNQVEIEKRELSVLINHKLNKHFFDFVNEYRINEAKKLLMDPEKTDLTVLEILYEVGFNSKSSFNTVFKKFTGTTPTQFRLNNLESAA